MSLLSFATVVSPVSLIPVASTCIQAAQISSLIDFFYGESNNLLENQPFIKNIFLNHELKKDKFHIKLIVKFVLYYYFSVTTFALAG